MAIEKISLDAINDIKEELDIEAQLPKINQLIDELSVLYMDEVTKLTENKPTLDESGDIAYDEIDEIDNKIALLNSIIDELSKLADVETFISEQMQNGLSEENAIKKFEEVLLFFESQVKKITSSDEEEFSDSI